MSTYALIEPFQIIAILFTLLTSITGDCTLSLSEDPLLRPKIFHIIGSLKVELPITRGAETVHLFENQNVELVCPTKFENLEGNEVQTNITVTCRHRSLEYLPYYFSVIQCSPLEWNLYESILNFVWCSKNVTSYLLARPSSSNPLINFEYLAGVCYDTCNNSLKTLYYRITPKFDNNYHPSMLEKFYAPVNEIEHYRDIFYKRSLDEDNYDNELFRDWIKYSKYNLSSILQIPRIYNEFYAGSFFDFPWWPSLRLGNWKRYEMALEKHIESTKKSYDVLAGLSDVVKVPVIEDCATNFTLKVLHDNVNRQLPFYVWNYLRATDNSSEIVIIGVNSPFYEFYAEEDVIFCKDICEEISWLKAKSSTFRYSALGVIFCCSVDEVKTTKRLDGFPTVNMDSLPHRKRSRMSL